MKYNKAKTKSRRKMRKMHFTAPAGVRRKIMSSGLTKELRKMYNTRSLPLKRDDEVCVIRGRHKTREGRVVKINRQKFKIYIERVNRDRPNGEQTLVGIHPSNVVITKLKIDPNRKKILDRKKCDSKKAKA